jgi:hypothetical protein
MTECFAAGLGLVGGFCCTGAAFIGEKAYKNRYAVVELTQA